MTPPLLRTLRSTMRCRRQPPRRSVERLLRLEPKELSPDGRGNSDEDLAGVGYCRLRDGRPGIRKREVRAFLKVKVQTDHGPGDNHKRIGLRDGPPTV
jgi:hypothetical protein